MSRARTETSCEATDRDGRPGAEPGRERGTQARVAARGGGGWTHGGGLVASLGAELETRSPPPDGGPEDTGDHTPGSRAQEAPSGGMCRQRADRHLPGVLLPTPAQGGRPEPAPHASCWPPGAHGAQAQGSWAPLQGWPLSCVHRRCLFFARRLVGERAKATREQLATVFSPAFPGSSVGLNPLCAAHLGLGLKCSPNPTALQGE